MVSASLRKGGGFYKGIFRNVKYQKGLKRKFQKCLLAFASRRSLTTFAKAEFIDQTELYMLLPKRESQHALCSRNSPLRGRDAFSLTVSKVPNMLVKKLVVSEEWREHREMKPKQEARQRVRSASKLSPPAGQLKLAERRVLSLWREGFRGVTERLGEQVWREEREKDLWWDVGSDFYK